MVAIFMGDDIGARELARRAETLVQFVEKSQVEIDMGVARAIERPGGGLAGAAASGCGIVISRECGRRKIYAALSQQRRPDIFRRTDDAAGEIIGGIVAARSLFLPNLRFRARAAI